jgi:hypothetical protein
MVPPGVAGAVGLVADGLDGAVGAADVGGALVATATALDDAAEALALAALPAAGCAEPQAATRTAAATGTPTIKGRRVARPAPPWESCTWRMLRQRRRRTQDL